jgi:hypothetical protein
MTDTLCGYADRDETIVAFLYDELDASRRRDFNAHLLTCVVCRDEVAGLRTVRTQLARWEPPALASPTSPVAATSRAAWWRTVPAWAQVAAALLFLGVSAGIANLDIRYDQNGLSITTGWSGGSGRSSGSGGSRGSGLASEAQSAKVGQSLNMGAGAAADAPWRSDLTALERQLRSELRAFQPSASAQAVRVASPSDAETLRRVRALLDESEKRQQRELALRIAEVVRDVNAQRQVDLRNIDHTLGIVRNEVGVEVLKQRQSLNLLYRASQRQ